VKPVFRKELMDMLRDKRVRSAAFISPIVLVLALLTILGNVIGGIESGGKKPSSTRVGAVKGSAAAGLLARAGFGVAAFPDEAQLAAAVAAGTPKVGVVDSPPVQGVTTMRVLFDGTEQLSQITLSRVRGALEGVNAKSLDAYLKTNGVPERLTRPLKIEQKDVAAAPDGKRKGASEMIVGFLPYLVVIWAFYGGMSTASDLVAGEKEKATLETLLISPVSRTQIVLGKLAALTTICLASSLASLVGLTIYRVVQPPGSKLMLEGGLGITPVSALIVLAILVPLCVLFASILLTFSTVARNSREAQTYLGIGSLVVVMPAMFSQFIGLTEYSKAAWVNLVPVLNAATQIRAALLGRPDAMGTAITVGSTLVLAAAAVALIVSLFNRESVLTRV
jgi:sodium transport system permease protein